MNNTLSAFRLQGNITLANLQVYPDFSLLLEKGALFWQFYFVDTNWQWQRDTSRRVHVLAQLHYSRRSHTFTLAFLHPDFPYDAERIQRDFQANAHILTVDTHST